MSTPACGSPVAPSAPGKVKIRQFLLVAALSLFLFVACDFISEESAPVTPTSVPPASTPPPERETEPAPTAAPTTAPTPGETGATNAAGRVLPVSIAEATPDIPEYDRDTWRHWTDEDGDCQNARQEVLIAESAEPVAFQSDDGCRVASGLWIGPYTGTVVDDPTDLDVDHMVPLENAHRSGGWSWSRERKREFANYLGYENHLIAATSGANRSKGSKGPEAWRPPLEDYWCVYAVDWVTIKNEWGLTVTEAEFIALSEMLATCETTVLLQPAQGTPPSPPTPTPTIPASLPTDLRYDPFGPDRDCGDFDTYEEALAFFLAAGGPEDDRHRLDVNGDGLPCESLPGGPSAVNPDAGEGIGATPAPAGSMLSGSSQDCFDTGPPHFAPQPSEHPQAQCAPATARAAALPALPLPTATPAPAPLPPTPSPPSPTPNVSGPESQPDAADAPPSPTPSPTPNVSGPESQPDAASAPPSPTPDVSPTPVAVPEPTAAPPSFANLPFDPDGPDRNCDDFSSWWEAQNFFLASGGPDADPHSLDSNGDGSACESLIVVKIDVAEPPTDGSSSQPERGDFVDRNCGDFATWSEANDFFIANGGPLEDSHGLDRNKDGVPCQTLPGAPVIADGGQQQDAAPAPQVYPEPTEPPSDDEFQDRNCGDFDTWQEAQDFFLSQGGPSQDPHRLDGDKNGVACESLPGWTGR